METQVLFAVADLSKSFEGTRALKGVSFDIRRGEFHALLGENGAGKSTLIKIVSGVYTATGGEIRWQGQVIRPESPVQAQRLGIGVVYQESSMIPGLSVAENFALGRESVGPAGWVKWDEVEGAAKRNAAQLQFAVDPGVRLGSLSVAEQKRVEIMKVLASDPDLIILDEPTAALTVEETDSLMAFLKLLKEQGKAILYVTHRLHEIHELVDRVTVLKDGQLMATIPAEAATTDRIVSLMVGRDIGELYPIARREPGQPLLQLQGVSRPGAFDAVDLTVRQGEIIGLVGLQGHGHFDVARSLFGSPKARSGTFAIAGEQMLLDSPVSAIRAGIGFVSEDRIGHSLLTGLSVRENAALPAVRHWSQLGVVNAIKERTEVRRLMDLLRVKAASPEVAIETLSGGNQQKVALSRWLAAGARILVLLDPTAGVDVGARMEIYRILRDLADNGGAVVIATSDLPEALGMCDDVYAFYRGRISGRFPRAGRQEADVLAAMTGHGREAG
jgi:ribose transport system ATP-binding protein